MEKENLIGFILLGIVALSGVAMQVFDTGEEITCRTGDGWTVVEDYGDYVKAECQYKTKDAIQTYCKADFRSTPSYERYGCSVVQFQPIEEQETTPIISGQGDMTCTHKGCYI